MYSTASSKELTVAKKVKRREMYYHLPRFMNSIYCLTLTNDTLYIFVEIKDIIRPS